MGCTMKKKMTFERKRTITGACFLLPSAVLCLIFIIVPLIDIFRYSVYEWNGIGSNMKFVGLANFLRLPSTEGFWEMAKATVIYVVGDTILVIVIAFLLALVLDLKGKGRINRNFLRAMWFVPCLLSGAIVGILWRIMYNYNNGLVNTLIGYLNLPKVNWLETYGVTMGAVIVASVWCQIGMCTIIFLAGLQSIPEDLLEVARIDGANYFQQLRKIVIPMMASSITINVITTTIAAFKAYELPFLVSNGLPGYSTRLLTQRIYFYGFRAMDYGTASALSVVLIIIITLISLLQLVVLKRREDIY